MVVQSIALPKPSGSPPDHELVAVGADTAVAPAAAGRSFHGRLLVPLLVAVQTAWLVLLAYGAIRILH